MFRITEKKKKGSLRKSGSDKAEKGKETKPVPDANLLVNKAVIEKGYEELAEKAYGKVSGKRLELSIVETLYLLENGKITLRKGRGKVGFDTLMKEGLKLDSRLHEKYVVFSDMRGRGLVVKTGFKFGCDFRVYKRGVGVKRGPKGPGEHTKWIVYVVPEDYTCAFQELSRAVRLAHSIRANMLWAIVDNENNVTYYQVLRFKP